jgi:chromosome partitioning protein
VRSIAIINQKGGVGKTTSAVNLSAALAKKGKRVCLLDMDPQAHASLHLGISLQEGEPSMYDILCGDAELADVCQDTRENLSVCPAHIDLAAAEMELATEVGREIILSDKLARDTREFDYLILDCPPSLGLLTLNALTAVNEVFLPLQPHFLALHGLSKLLRTIQIVGKRLNPSLQLTGVVLCMYDTNTRLAAEVHRDVQEFFAAQSGAQNGEASWCAAKNFTTCIRRNIRLAEAPSFGQSIFEYAPACHGSTDYEALAGEVMDMQVYPRVVAEAA